MEAANVRFMSIIKVFMLLDLGEVAMATYFI